MNHGVVEATYLGAAVCFILSLMWMSHPSTSRRGVVAGELGMLLAIVATLLLKEVVPPWPISSSSSPTVWPGSASAMPAGSCSSRPARC